MPTRDEIRNLTQRVEELNAKVEQLKPRVTRRGRSGDRDPGDRDHAHGPGEDHRLAEDLVERSGSGSHSKVRSSKIGLALAAGAPGGGDL